MEAQLKDAGFEVELQYASNDIATQLNQIDAMIDSGCNVIVISAIEGSSLGQALDKAAEKGVKVIAYDRLLMDNEHVDYYATFNNYMVGTVQGTYVKEALDLDNAEGPFYMEITAGDPGDNNARYFYQGAIDVVKPYIDAGKIIVRSGQTEFDQVATPTWKTDVAQARAEDILASNYADGTERQAWVCSNDSTALGVAQAISSDYAGDNTIIVTGQDADDTNLINIFEGKQTMSVYKNLANEVAVTLAVAKAALEGEIDGEALSKTFGIECDFDTESYETTPGNKCPSFLLVPTVVTKDNMQVLADTGLYAWNADNTYVQKVK
jgi:putative multiple sugar transport system substrate-binding protein